MAMLFSSGQYMNNLEQARAITMVPTADSLFPGSNAGDSRLSRVAMHGSNAANPYIQVDMAPLDPNTDTSTRTFYARAGSTWNVGGFSGSITCRIQNAMTKKWLTSAGAWQVAQTNCRSSTATALNFAVESTALCQDYVAELELTVSSGTGGTVWPSWNSAVVYGHNLDPGLTVAARYSDDGFTGDDNLAGTLSAQKPALSLFTSQIDDRWFELYCTGTNRSAPWYAEIIVTEAYSHLAPLMKDGYEIKYVEPQLGGGGRWGPAPVYNLAPWPRRIARYSFYGDTTWQPLMRQRIVGPCRGMRYPILLVPIASEGGTYDAPIYGRLSEEWSERRLFNTFWKNDIVISEEAIAVPLEE